jgi:hypothetical protein
MDKFEREVITPELGNIEDARCNGTTLTGDNSLEDLKIAINSVRQYIATYRSDRLDKGNELVPLYATSVVSHGVDLDELNLMIFQGIPYSTSEYIQALSRVGRKNLGIVLVWFYPNRVRDDSFYRNFTRYHETLDHQVKPIPIKRLSRLGIHQTINSLFSGAIINYISDIKGQPTIHKKEVQDITPGETEQLVKFIRKCYTGKTNGGALNVNLDKEVEERLNFIKMSSDNDRTYFPNILTKSGNYFYRNQSGMRGIQRELALDLDYDDQVSLRNKG